MQVKVLINSPGFAHRIPGNRHQTELYLPRLSQLNLETLKCEVMDTFGLFDISHGSTDDSTNEAQLKSRFTLNVRFLLNQ